MSQQSEKKEHADQVKADKAAAEAELENTDSLGQVNPAWELEKKNIAAAAKRTEEADKEAQKEAK